MPDIEFTTELKKLNLSPRAEVFVRDESGYVERTKRWQRWREPDIAAVVEVATAEDIVETIRFSNTHNVPFTAFSSGHGDIASLGSIENGIQIHLRKINSIIISADGKYATIGGGAKGKEVTDALWEAGKWTVHGVCESVSLAGVALRGGHGLLQGRYGLLSDQTIALDVVLADGKRVKVSTNQHPELFWAMQGAGHNFGIVTSLDCKIYDIPDMQEGGKVWSWERFDYDATPENVSRVYGVVAKGMLDGGKQPDGVLTHGLVELDGKTSKLVIKHHVMYNGPLSTIRSTSQLYHELSPLSVISNEGIFLDIPRFIGTDEQATACHLYDVIPGAGILRFPVDIKTFSELVTSSKDFTGSFLMIGGYSTRAVKAVDRSRSVVPWRDHGVLIALAVLYEAVDEGATPPVLNEELNMEAWENEEEIRRALINGAEGEYYSYVNYAYGGETLGEMYGDENLGRLRELKRKYDSENRFAYFAPIIIKGGETVE